MILSNLSSNILRFMMRTRGAMQSSQVRRNLVIAVLSSSSGLSAIIMPEVFRRAPDLRYGFCIRAKRTCFVPSHTRTQTRLIHTQPYPTRPDPNFAFLVIKLGTTVISTSPSDSVLEVINQPKEKTSFRTSGKSLLRCCTTEILVGLSRSPLQNPNRTVST